MLCHYALVKIRKLENLMGLILTVYQNFPSSRFCAIWFMDYWFDGYFDINHFIDNLKKSSLLD